MVIQSKAVNADLGLFLVRVALGLVFVLHGWDKLGNLEGTVGFFGSLGLPAVIAYLVAAVELLGGLAMILGLWTKWAGWALAIVMLGAIYFVKAKMGFIGGYELDLSLLLMALGVAFTGPGSYTIQSLQK